MKLQLIIDPEAEESIVATVHSQSELTEKLKALVADFEGR